MSEEKAEKKRVCPSCGAEVPKGAPEGLCPRCVLKEAAAETRDEEATLPARLQAPPLETVAAAFPELEVIELIGCGGMGAVFKARQRKLDRLVALKVLPRSFGEDAGFNERFEREGKLLAKLNHPNIVGVFDFGEAGGFYFLLMEYVEGVNLRQAMRAGKFTPEQALKIVPDICGALQFAHEAGILHRDVKPENILIDAKGRVKMADFGIAKMVGVAGALEPTLTRTGAVGTPQYMAPEQFESPREVDHRADIYSLGVVFYEMLTGELPMGRFAPPSAKSEVDARVDDIVMRALAKERELRQQSANEVRTEVENVTADVWGLKGRAAKSRAEKAGVAAVNPWPRRIFWTLVALGALPVLVFVMLIASYAAAGPAGGSPGVMELVVIVAILAFGFLVLGGIVLGIAHLAGWRRYPPAKEAAAGGAAVNPWPRRVFWLIVAVVFVPFVLVPVSLVLPWMATRAEVKEASGRTALEREKRELLLESSMRIESATMTGKRVSLSLEWPNPPERLELAALFEGPVAIEEERRREVFPSPEASLRVMERWGHIMRKDGRQTFEFEMPDAEMPRAFVRAMEAGGTMGAWQKFQARDDKGWRQLLKLGEADGYRAYLQIASAADRENFTKAAKSENPIPLEVTTFERGEGGILVMGDAWRTLGVLVFEEKAEIASTGSVYPPSGESRIEGTIAFEGGHDFAFLCGGMPVRNVMIDGVAYDLREGGRVFDLAPDGSVTQRKMWPKAIDAMSMKAFFENLDEARKKAEAEEVNE